MTGKKAGRNMRDLGEDKKVQRQNEGTEGRGVMRGVWVRKQKRKEPPAQDDHRKSVLLHVL